MGTIKINDTTYGASIASEIDFNNEVSELEATNVQEAINELSKSLPFKLGIDKDGNYGYIKDGADTVTPFSNNDPKKLYEALRWSDIPVTEDMTYDEMIAIIAAKYPEFINLLHSDYFTADGYVTVNNGQNVQFTHRGGEGVTITKYSAFVMNNFKTLDVYGNYYIATDSSVTSHMTLSIENESGGTIAQITYQAISGKPASRRGNFEKTIDMTNYIGKNFRFKAVLYHRYQYGDYMNMTKCLLHN